MAATPSQPASLTLLIPVYNGAAFLENTLRQAWDWLTGLDRPTELLVVDDGSRDRTPEILAEFAARHAGSERPKLSLLCNQPNRGKGYAVRRGWLCAGSELVVFTDADLTYPLDNLLPLVVALEGGADLAYGSRMHPDSRYVVAPTFFGKLFTRHLMGRMFNLLVRTIVVPGVLDSQAGLKGLRGPAARELAGRVQLNRFSFDVEMLYVARRRGYTLRDCPVLFLYRKEPSTVHFVRDSLAMLRDMLRVRWRGLRGGYERPLPPALLDELRRGGKAPAPGKP